MASFTLLASILFFAQQVLIEANWTPNLKVYEIREGKNDQKLDVYQVFPAKQRQLRYNFGANLGRLFHTDDRDSTIEIDSHKTELYKLDKISKDLIDGLKTIKSRTARINKAKKGAFERVQYNSEDESIDKSKASPVGLSDYDIRQLLELNNKYRLAMNSKYKLGQIDALRTPYYNVPEDRTSRPRTKYVYSSESNR